MDREEDHVVGHGTERDDDDDPEDARKHASVDGPICDFIHELFDISTTEYSDSTLGRTLSVLYHDVADD